MNDDEREALIDAMMNVEGVDGMVELNADYDRRAAGFLADAILAAGFKRLPEITEAMVDAGVAALTRADGTVIGDIYPDDVAIILEAAWEARHS